MPECVSPIRMDEDRGFAAVETLRGDLTAGLIFLCDHARNALPATYQFLGLPPEQLLRHIAYDIGAENVMRALCETFDASAAIACFSRLLIDPNRGEDDPTLIMPLSDGVIIPGNRHVDEIEREHRLNAYYRPYHRAIDSLIDQSFTSGVIPVIVSIHSYTHDWRGFVRPWHVGVLWDRDPRFAQPLIAALRRREGLVIGDNEPYSGALAKDTLNRHAARRGCAHVLVEIRQDLINDDTGVRAWSGVLCDALREALQAPDLHVVRRYGSAFVR